MTTTQTNPTATTPGPAPAKLLYSVPEAAELLSIGRTLAFQLIADGTLPSFKLGNRRLVSLHDLNEFVTRQREASAR